MRNSTKFPIFIQNFPTVALPPGVQGHTTLLNTEAGQVVFHTIPEGQEVPLHEYKDSYAVLVSGSLDFTLGDETFEAIPGKAIFIPAGTLHGGKALEESLMTEVFCEKRWKAE